MGDINADKLRKPFGICILGPFIGHLTNFGRHLVQKPNTFWRWCPTLCAATSISFACFNRITSGRTL